MESKLMSTVNYFRFIDYPQEKLQDRQPKHQKKTYVSWHIIVTYLTEKHMNQILNIGVIAYLNSEFSTHFITKIYCLCLVCITSYTKTQTAPSKKALVPSSLKK